jgi:hypothetical protein
MTMRIRPVAALVCVLVFAALMAAGAEAGRKLVKIYDCPRVEGTPKVDGLFAEPLYRDMSTLSPFKKLMGTGLRDAEVQTEARVFYNDEALYVALRFLEPNMDKLRANRVSYDSKVWWDDCVEVYVRPGSGEEADMFKFLSIQIGTKFDSLGGDSAWGAGTAWEVGVSRHEDAWHAEFRIPFTDMGVRPPSAGELWAFQIVRFRRAGKMEYSAWSQGGNYQHPEKFGYLNFGGVINEATRLIEERIVPRKGPELRINAAEGELLYTGYESLLRACTERLAELRSTCEFERRLLDDELGGKVAQKLDARAEELVQKAESIRQAGASPGTCKRLKEVEAQFEELLWDLRYWGLLGGMEGEEK